MMTLATFLLIILAALYLQIRKGERAKGKDFRASPIIVKIFGGSVLALLIVVSAVGTWKGGLTKAKIYTAIDAAVIAVTILYYRYLKDRNDR